MNISLLVIFIFSGKKSHVKSQFWIGPVPLNLTIPTIYRFPVGFPWWPPPSVAAVSLHPVGCSHSPRVSPPGELEGIAHPLLKVYYLHT